MQIWAIANQKGGVGKTTTTAALGALMAEEGMRVLLVDMDPHASLSGYFSLEDLSGMGSVYELFRENNPPMAASLTRDTGFQGLSLLPANAPMATLDRQLARRQATGRILGNALALLSNSFDYVLLDCPPTLGLLMVNALVASQLLLMPTQTEALALDGLERMQRTVQMIERSMGRVLPRWVVPTMYDAATLHGRSALMTMRERYRHAVTRNVIAVDPQICEAAEHGLPLNRWPAATESADSYRALLRELLGTERQVSQASA
ncbi:ParA family protein [Rhodanobacter sp. MP7CTX1]|uniref:ParA family protein n=1 Tax=Rhodanobacter sp. MP7CTX1 TaxID=2723084 RepID=UPI00160F8E53|nr:ParA family protein [Rhodanobacter sp. MP7CTX1]MBB6186227.1 chromosome partitioning protein [Rhodanobacter sp. MP7CTX1]